MKRLSVLMAVAFVDMMGLMIIWPLLPLYANNLGASATVVGLLAASFPVAQLVASPVWGYVSDRYGRRPALLVGLGASAFAYVVFGFAHTVWLLFVSRFVQGLGGGTTGVVQAYVADPTRPISLLIWIYALAMLAFNALPPIFSLYLHDRFAITADQIGFFFMVFGAVGVLMRTAPVGWFNAKLGEVRTMQVGTLLLLAGFILVPLAPTLTLFVCAQILLPLGTALLFPANSALVSHRAHHDEIGLTLGVQQTYRGLAAIVGPVYAGGAYQSLGQHIPFFISAAIIVVVAYLTLRIPEQDRPPQVAVST